MKTLAIEWTKKMSDDLAEAIIEKLGLEGQGVHGVSIRIAYGKPTQVVVELFARRELETLIASELQRYELKAPEAAA